ncbi:MAG TPA: DEAD/DEAH box helicase [Opitutaceae bacterium]|nr:DEAD/DEAH box helicase [Opitutaceae bacterium]
MLRKLIARLRESIAPAATKPAQSAPHGGPHGGPRPHEAAAPRRQEQGAGRPHGQGQRGPGRGPGAGKGPQQGGPAQGKPQEFRPRQEERRPAGRGPARGGPARHGDARRARPARDDFEHPGHSPAKPVAVDIPKMDTAFSRLGLQDALAYAVREKGYTDPTPIQVQAIPLILEGRDVIGSAQTGTGKTAAFALPIIQRLGGHGAMRCLVLEPTRELALQVEEAFHKYALFTDLRVTIVYGGVGYGKQTDDLRRGMDILAATPGRLLDHLEQGNCSLDKIEILVLDEVDRMLDMGFLPDVKRIVQKCAKNRQTLFFTATLPPEIEQLAGWALSNPAKVEIGRKHSAADTISHAFYPVVAQQKFDLLQLLLEKTDFKSVLIFCRTRMGADRIAGRLVQKGHSVGVLHSDRSQRERVEALEGFKSGKTEVLVATDIAARGLDIAGVSHVINYDVPENAEDYVHRIGRTGRALHTGDAFTLVTEDDVRDARSIERFIGASVERKKIDGFPYVYSALFDQKVLDEALPKASSSRLHRGSRR